MAKTRDLGTLERQLIYCREAAVGLDVPLVEHLLAMAAMELRQQMALRAPLTAAKPGHGEPIDLTAGTRLPGS